ncbi:MAG: endonuclease III [Candidatus Lokiarchaeota archaeon]|nr:endonuclease III [Candidatus Harpocratesius repetitus]
MKNKGSIISCKDEKCRVEMLHKMFDTIKGYSLLLEQLQPDPKNYQFNSSEIRKPYAFKTLVATILSVRSRDETTIKVIENLWQHYSTPKDLAEAPIEHIEELIHSSGTYKQKAKRIKETARIIHEKYNDKVPDDLSLLVQLPGVGRKVANCVLVVSFNKPAIPVDTHVHRIANRIGWVETKTPEKTEHALEKLFPKEEWMRINYTMVSFGKNICKPINPLCDICPIEKNCEKKIQKNDSRISKTKKRTKNKR